MPTVIVQLERIDINEFYGLRTRGRQKSRHKDRPSHKTKDAVKCVFMDTTSGEDTVPMLQTFQADKSSPSGYQLAAHQYIAAKKQGLIQGPRTRT